MMGMSDWVFWGSHFINYFSVMLVQVALFTIFFSVGFGGRSLAYKSDAFLVFAILIIFSAQSILFCMTITTVFNRPVIAVVVTVILWIVTYAVPYRILYPGFKQEIDVTQNNPQRLATALLPNMGLSWCFSILGSLENSNIGANWSNLFSSNELYQNMAIGHVLAVMLASCFIYGLLIYYIDSIWPWQFGVPKPFYFPFTKTFWCPERERNDDEGSVQLKRKHPKNFEADPQLPVGIRVVNLHKEFGGFGGSARKVAVENVNLNIYRGQITVLLGHNGAGKTTSMNMITGIFPPSRGTAYVNGYDIRYQTSQARRSMSLCPQENIIYNELSVYQHLKLYAVLKGYPWSEVDREIDHTLKLLRLMDKKDSLASSLSGGMKRKLALGIALIGGTETLILDEPTSGMDPEARRAIWDLLQEIRKQRTILLTTHFMEEADVS